MTQTHDAFSGSWKANHEQSRFDPNHRPSQASMRLEPTGYGYELRAEGIHEGKPCVDKTTIVLDGAEHPVDGAPGVSSFSFRSDPRTIRMQGKRDGQVIGEATYAVSEDGARLTATVWGTDAQQRHFQTVVVFDRE